MARLMLTHRRAARETYYGDEALAGLRAIGEVVVNQRNEPMHLDELIRLAGDCDIIVSDRETPGPAALFDQLPNLVAFVRVAVDIRNVDVPAASQRGILVTHASAGFIASVSEWVIGAMIDLARHVSDSVIAYRAGRKPEVAMGRQLKGSTIGVVGHGAIGRALCDLASAFGMRVLASDPYVSDFAPGVAGVGMQELLAESDFIVSLAVATDETENLFDAAAFAAMKPGAFFVNASRGNLVDEAAMRAALAEGHLAGVAMDVGRAPDQMPTPALAALPQVVATPHVGGLTPEAVRHQAMETVRQCAAIVAGDIPPGAANADAATRMVRFRGG